MSEVLIQYIHPLTDMYKRKTNKDSFESAFSSACAYKTVLQKTIEVAHEYAM